VGGVIAGGGLVAAGTVADAAFSATIDNSKLRRNVSETVLGS
jgi:hypothetical protein